MPENTNDFDHQDSTGSGDLRDETSLVAQDAALPPHLVVLPIASGVVFPSLMAPILVTLPKYIAAVEEAISRHRTIALLVIKDGDVREGLEPKDLYTYGVAAKILKRLKMPDGSINLLVHSIKRLSVQKVIAEAPHLTIEARYLNDIDEKSTEMDALTRTVVAHVKKLSETNPFFTEEMRLAMINAPGPGTVADLVAFALALPRDQAQEFLETLQVRKRFEILLNHLRREQDVADVQKRINEEVNHKLSKMQREFFLREQLKLIKKELGSDEPSGEGTSKKTFKERIEALAVPGGMPEDVKVSALEEVEKFETLSENSPEYNVTRNYLETLCSLPWVKTTEDNLEIAHAREVLDEDHYGLEKVKERILEFLSVRKLKNDKKGSIICLVGPPGVGKTSVGKSIARTLGRSFYRFSLGGMRDEAEIKGHRRTYVGAMPGKVINGVRRAGTKNCVLMLDEIDKLGQSYQGDPASALLEVLDPEQNVSFIDHYLDVPFDLSNVLFIATANTMATIPGPLLDRMEVIELPGYTLEEKEDIALKYVIPKELETHGLKKRHLRFDRAALQKMMKDYSREPGLRTLQQLIGKICRKVSAKVVAAEEKNRSLDLPIRITEDSLTSWLGPKRFYNEMAERISAPGVVVGLAWTQMGGDILFIEASDLIGSGNLKLTGQMGNVMTESAAIAWTYVKKRVARELKLDAEFFKGKDFHLHIPAGAIPKDGPSAGVTMATALYSLLTGRIANQRLAMTGELSLIGKVLPVGGIKEKILAAKRAGITEIILPKHNQKDVSEVPDYALRGMKIHYVDQVDQVFELALQKSLPAPAGHVLRVKPVKRTKLSSKARSSRASSARK